MRREATMAKIRKSAKPFPRRPPRRARRKSPEQPELSFERGRAPGPEPRPNMHGTGYTHGFDPDRDC
jgi:hypothetical protein